MANTASQQIQDKISRLEKGLKTASTQPRSEFTGGVERRTVANLPGPMAGRVALATDALRPDGGSGELEYNDGTVWIGVHDFASYSQYAFATPEYTVAALPAPPSTPANTRAVAFATNGRKSGEGIGAGTGVPCYWNSASSQWLRYEDNSVVVA